MYTPSQRAAVRKTIPFAVASFLAFGVARGEEGVFANGQRIQGELSSDGQGRVLFQPLGQKQRLLLDQLDHVRFPATRLPPLRAGAPYHVLLRGGERLTGELLGLGSDKVQLRTAWSERISIPRAAVAAVSHAAGFVTMFVGDFENDLKSWRLAGAPALTATQHVSGRRCLCFNAPAQQAEHILPVPVTAGRAGINFRDGANEAKLGWRFEAEFGTSAGWANVRIERAPRASAYSAEVSGARAVKSRLPPKDGWQRLTMEFGPDTLVLSIDDDILWSGSQPESGGALRKVRLCCTALPSETGAEGEVFFDGFSVARPVPELRHPKGDTEQDELWLVSGDQVFGSVLEATSNKIQLHCLFGPRSLSWGDVRGVYFRRQSTPVRKPDSRMVRVWLQPGIGLEPDALDGTIQRLDGRCLVLDHEFLGRLEIDRKRLHRLKSLPEGVFRNER